MSARNFCGSGAAVLLLAACGGTGEPTATAAPAAAHEIPRSAIVQMLVKPDGHTLRVLIRAPLASMRDIEFPEREGFLDIPASEPALLDAVVQWILPELALYEDGRPLTRPVIGDVRISLPSDRSFESFERAAAHMRAPALPGDVRLPWDQALLDAFTVYGTQLLLPFSDYPVGVGSVFIIDPLYTLPLLVGVIGALLLRARAPDRAARWNAAGLALGTLYLGWSVAAQSHVEGVVHRTIAATPLVSTTACEAPLAATPTTRPDTETMPSLAPSTAARSQPTRSERWRSRWVRRPCEGGSTAAWRAARGAAESRSGVGVFMPAA